jgi:hypothetical protein
MHDHAHMHDHDPSGRNQYADGRVSCLCTLVRSMIARLFLVKVPKREKIYQMTKNMYIK